MTASGTYYDGKTSAGIAVNLIAGESLRLVGSAGTVREESLIHLRIDPPLGTARRLIRFTDGAVCETGDGIFLAGLLERQGKGRGARRLHRWEKSLRLAFLALVLTVAATALVVRFVVPAAADRLARAIPRDTENALGRQTLDTLDRFALKKTKLPPDRAAALRRLFAEVVAGVGDGRGYRLELRSSEAVGANAFALPGGSVILTDELVALARNDVEIAAVLAHEAAHVRYRHALRHILQNSAATLLIASVTGDIVSLTSLSATLPTMIIDARYSREFEQEADDAAVDYLVRRGASPRVYAEMLGRLDAEFRTRTGGGGGFPEILSTHPETEKRVRRIVAGERR